MSAPLKADREQIARAINKLFVYADPGTYVSFRAFRHRDNRPMWPRGYSAFPCEVIGDSLEPLIDRLACAATWAASLPEPTVLCPPVCTLNNAGHARERDMANGLALAVECDQMPARARSRLEELLGPATLVVASGGEWTDPANGKRQAKLHLYWRLDEPTRDELAHRHLKRARDYAAQLIGADMSGVPMVHPMRLAGSWHTKNPAAPRLARIIAESGNEIGLIDTAEMLEMAGGHRRCEIKRGIRPPDHWQELAEGVSQGTIGRINAVTSIIGYLLAKGVEPRLAAALTRAYNATLCFPPVPETKVEDAIENIAARELEKQAS